MKMQALFQRFKLVILAVALLSVVLMLFSYRSMSLRSIDIEEVSINGEAVYAAPTLGVIVDQQWRVVDIEEGSAAQKYGLQRGDVILQLSDLKIVNTTSIVSALPNVRTRVNPGEALDIVLLRKGQKITLKIQPSQRLGKPGQATPTAVPIDQIYF